MDDDARGLDHPADPGGAAQHVLLAKDLPDPIDFPAEPGSEPHLKSVLVTLEGDARNEAPRR